MPKKLKKNAVCLKCRRAVSFSRQRYEFARFISHGLDRDRVKSLLPRCEKCANALFDAGEVVIPPVAIAREKRPVVLAALQPEHWPAMLAGISGQRGDFVCVRREDPAGNTLLVCTTAVLPGLDPQPRLEVAKVIEKAVVARPAGAYPRFIASRAWGGNE